MKSFRCTQTSLLSVCAVLLTCSVGAHGKPEKLERLYGQGTIDEQVFSQDSQPRRFLIYTPQELSGKRPAVLVLHGFNGTAELSRYYGFEKLADREGFTVIYPEGPGNEWRVGYNYPHQNELVRERDDLSYFRAIHERLESAYHEQVDLKNVFVVGQSMGGLMAMTMACDMGEYYRGFAAVVSGLSSGQRDNCRPGVSNPVLFIVGSADTLMPPSNGQSKAIVGADGKPLWLVPFEEGLGFWAERNSCTGREPIAVLEKKRLLADDATYVERTDYRGCREGMVSGYRVVGMGHRWPGSRFQEQLGELLGVDNIAEKLGPTTFELDGADAIWQFFKATAPDTGY